MKKFMSEFKEFISKGDVMSMAVGIIIGGAFTAIVKAGKQPGTITFTAKAAGVKPATITIEVK